MPGTNDFQTFASAGGANVMSQAQYLALAAKATGFQSGIAASNQLNKVWRQSSIISAMIAQFICDQINTNAVDDGTIAALEANFILALQAATQIKLTSNLNLYVNASTGNDVNNGTSLATAFRTPQAAFNAGYNNYNYNQHTLTVNLAAGTYTSGIVLFGLPVGCTGVTLLGNPASPSSYQINATNSAAISINIGCNATITGVILSATGTASGQGYGIACNQGSVLVQNCVFGSCATVQIASLAGSIITLANSQLQGTSQYGLSAQAGGALILASTAISFNAAVYSGATAYSNFGYIFAVGNTITGTATGNRYLASNNGVITTNTANANLFPGTIAGAVSAGGQYN